MNWPAGNDPWHTDNPADNGGSGINGGRRAYYNINGTPSWYINAAHYQGNPTANAFSQAILNAADQESPLLISIDGMMVDGELRTTIEVTSAENLQDLTLFVSLNEHYYNWRGSNGQTNWYHSMLKMIPDWHGTNFDIDADETLQFEFTQNMDGIGWHDLEEDNLVIAVWVQASNRAVQQAESYAFNYATPHVTLFEWELSDEAGGNGDGRPEPGETIDLIVTVELPEPYVDAESFMVNLTCEDEEIELTNATFEHGAFEAGQFASNEETPFRFIVAEDFIPHPITLNLVITAQPNDWEISQDLTFMVGWPDVLLLDASENPDATERMTTVFGVDPLPYADYMDVTVGEGIPEGLLDHYDAVIWTTFNNNMTTYFDFESVALANYLENGGKLVVSSPYTCIDYGNSAFFRNYLSAGLDSSDVNARRVYGYDVNQHFAGTNLLLLGGDGAGPPDVTPSLTALGDAVPVVYYRRGDSDAGAAGVLNETDTYKTLLLSFPIESIGGSSDTEKRGEFVSRILNALFAVTSAPPDDGIQPIAFALDPAYPNPFNSTAVIPFTLNQSGRTTLKLFDLSGREMVSLLDAALPAGAHQVTLNASLVNLAAGLYYVQLTSPSGVNMRKVVFLR